MAKPKNISELRELYEKDKSLKNVSKTDLAVLLLNTPPAGNDTILHEIRELRMAINESTTKVNQEIGGLRKVVEKQRDIIAAHQGVWEEVDGELRAGKLVAFGIREDADDHNVIDRMFSILQENSVGSYSHRRLGKEQTGRYRPILITLQEARWRNGLIANGKELKRAGKEKIGHVEVDWSKVFVKKDQHPAVQREWRRLHAVVKQEKAKPENTGNDIRLDYKTRQVTRNWHCPGQLEIRFSGLNKAPATTYCTQAENCMLEH